MVDVKFDESDNPLNPLDKMKKSEIRLAKANNDQIGLKPNVGKIGKGNKKKFKCFKGYQ